MNEGKMFSPEEQAKLQKTRTVNDAELIKGTPTKLGGADYVADENGPRLELDKWQVEEAKKEMGRGLERQSKEKWDKYGEEIRTACKEFDTLIENNDTDIEGLTSINSEGEFDNIINKDQSYDYKVSNQHILVIGPSFPRQSEPGWEYVPSNVKRFMDFSKKIIFIPYESYDKALMKFLDERNPEIISRLKIKH